MLRSLSVFILLLLAFSASAQNVKRAQVDVDTLCSDYMQGRGYVDHGMLKAAAYLAGQFDKIGLVPFRETFMHPFKENANSLPGKLVVKADGKQLQPGFSYLVSAATPAFNGEYNVTLISATDALKRKKLNKKLKAAAGTWVYINYTEIDQKPRAVRLYLKSITDSIVNSADLNIIGLITVSGKLTWHTSKTVAARPHITLFKDSVINPPTSLRLEVETEYFENLTMYNVAGFVPGKISNDSIIVITAHYDHLGMMGKETMFRGANDNASGTAMLLEFMRYYTNRQTRPEFKTVFIAFGAEELGLVGSRHFADNPLFPLERVKLLINLDMTGTGEEGITVVNGKIYENEFNKLAQLNERLEFLVPEVKIRGESCNSDHCPFYEKGVKSFFIYTRGGIQAYHDVYDVPETLPFTKFSELHQLLREFISGL